MIFLETDWVEKKKKTDWVNDISSFILKLTIQIIFIFFMVVGGGVVFYIGGTHFSLYNNKYDQGISISCIIDHTIES